MEQLEFFPIPSPCIGVCSMDEKGYCLGCFRKREERFSWLEMNAAQRLHVIHLCRQRYRRKQRAVQNQQQGTDDNNDSEARQNTLF